MSDLVGNPEDRFSRVAAQGKQLFPKRWSFSFLTPETPLLYSKGIHFLSKIYIVGTR